MGELQPKRSLSAAKKIALVGIAAATVECGKLALSFLPNIEVVSILLAVYGYVFGYAGVLAAVVFVCIEPLIWGFGSWVITYFIYWPALAFVFCLLGRARMGSRWLSTGIAVAMTLFFGILSSVIDTAFLIGITPRFFSNLLLYYLRGIPFYALQLACNAVLFPTLFVFLTKKLKSLRRNFKI